MWPFTSTPLADPTTAPEPSACPVDHETRKAWTEANPSPAGGHPTTAPAPERAAPVGNRLSTDREISSIPRWLPPTSSSSAGADGALSPSPSPATATTDETACPARSAPSPSTSPSTTSATPTQQPPQENWVYPSPSSFYTALQRKNRDPSAKDMPIVVPIHNAVNERVWEQVMAWEREAAVAEGRVTREELERAGKCADRVVGSKLVSFVGKPKELSPRARWKTLIGYTAPFDRHDWIVDRPLLAPSPSTTPSSETPQSLRIRYVIDFYTGRGAGLLHPSIPPGSGSSPEENFMPNLAFYIDVRPALDGWEGVRMRAGRWWRDSLGMGAQAGAAQGAGGGGERGRPAASA
ncbi:cytochrome c/c1 heme-lyase [Leucosporidium creatinivorum]|uniref:Holocytochrome c-type synthase n=1 Tax=Leucosporidium creatinivorum TaxID=106004 RepID=A0A1Y2F191_9BASI|nr:cytochrome c/c1 heme-lyase [Leucosporidium creatinivorum]